MTLCKFTEYRMYDSIQRALIFSIVNGQLFVLQIIVLRLNFIVNFKISSHVLLGFNFMAIGPQYGKIKYAKMSSKCTIC